MRLFTVTCLFLQLVDVDPLFADSPVHTAGTLIGVVEVKDGDGLLFGEVELRLQGIAAPEDRRGKIDDGGKDATAALKALAHPVPQMNFALRSKSCRLMLLGSLSGVNSTV